MPQGVLPDLFKVKKLIQYHVNVSQPCVKDQIIFLIWEGERGFVCSKNFQFFSI